jgi:hypothetical protein
MNKRTAKKIACGMVASVVINLIGQGAPYELDLTEEEAEKVVEQLRVIQEMLERMGDKLNASKNRR